MGLLSGFTIAFTIRSVDRSLSSRLIAIRSFDPTLQMYFSNRFLIICSKAINGIDGARDGEQNPAADYSEVVEMRAHTFDKL